MRADHEAEFRVFAASRWPRLVRTAFLLTGDPHDAEDLAQTVLTKVFRSWRRVQRADNVDTYLRRVLVNANRSRFRKRRVTESLTAEIPESAHPRDADPGALVAQRRALVAALAELPARQRAVVVLRYWDDVPDEDIATALGCAVGTVRSHAFRALAKLRKDARLTDIENLDIVKEIPHGRA